MIYLKTVDSTQKYIFNNYKNIPLNEYVISKIQTNGYGRTGLWDSLEKNLYFSKLVKNEDNLWLRVLVSMQEICQKYVANSEIKLPNDIYVNNKKLGGFIIEPIEKNMIIGVGINIESQETAYKTSIMEKSKIEINLFDFANEFNNILNINLTKDIYEIHKKYINGIKIINDEIKFVLRKTNIKKTGVVNYIYYDMISINNIEYNMMEIKIL